MTSPALVGPGLRAVRRILVVHARGGLGDVLLATPVLDALHKRYPDAPIDMLVRPGARAMVEHHPLVSELMVVEENALDQPSCFKDWLVRVRARKYSLGVVLWSKFAEASLLYRARVRHRVGQDSRLLYSWMYTRRVRVRSEHGDEKSHWVECLLDYARAVGAELEHPRPRLYLPDTARAEVAEILHAHGLHRADPLVVLHVGRGTPLTRERLPLEPFARIGDALVRAFRGRLVLTGSPAEADVVDGVMEEMAEPADTLAGALSVPQLGALMERARVVVSSDSGPMHMAAAVNTPTVGLFAMEKDLPMRWGPYGEGHQVVRPEKFRCKPECLKETCPRMACYEDLEAPAVVHAARRAVAERRRVLAV